MKKLLAISLLFFFLATAAEAQTVWQSAQTYLNPPNSGVPAAQVQGGCQGGVCTYVPLEPLTPYGSLGYRGIAEGGQSSYLSTAFRLLISLGGLFAVVMLVWSGIRYMLSESFTEKGLAVKRIQAALWGLLLLASSWLILYVINPDLLKFKLITDNIGGLGSGSGAQSLTNTVGAGSGTFNAFDPADREKIEQFRNQCETKRGSVKIESGGNYTCSVLQYEP